MDAEGPVDRLKPTPQPEPQEIEYEAPVVVDEGGGSAPDRTDQRASDQPLERQPQGAADDWGNDQPVVVDEGGGAAPDRVPTGSAGHDDAGRLKEGLYAVGHRLEAAKDKLAAGVDKADAKFNAGTGVGIGDVVDKALSTPQILSQGIAEGIPGVAKLGYELVGPVVEVAIDKVKEVAAEKIPQAVEKIKDTIAKTVEKAASAAEKVTGTISGAPDQNRPAGLQALNDVGGQTDEMKAQLARIEQEARMAAERESLDRERQRR